MSRKLQYGGYIEVFEERRLETDIYQIQYNLHIN